MPESLPLPSGPESEGLLEGTERFCAWVQTVGGAAALLVGLGSLLVHFSSAAQAVVEHGAIMVMRANTALGLCMAALSVLLWRNGAQGARMQLARLLGLATAAIGGLTAAEDLLGVDLGLDELLLPGTFPGDVAAVFVSHPGRMSLNASLSFLLLGISLTVLEWKVSAGRLRVFHPAPAFALLGALPSSFGMVGYLLGSSQFTGILRSTNILFHTAAALLVLAAATLASRPHRPPVARLFSQGPDGVLLRWLLPGSMVLLMALAWLIARGRASGLVAAGEGTALMLFGGLVLLSILIVVASGAVARQNTRARLAQAALREEERRSRAVLDTSLDGVLLMDTAGLIVDWNPVAERIFGRSRAEVIGLTVAETIIPERLRSAHWTALHRYLESGDGRVLGKRLEVAVIRRDGAEFPVELSVNVLAGTERRLFVGFIRDITERRASEAALRAATEKAREAAQATAQSAERFRVLSEVVALQVWTATPDGFLDYANHEVAEYFGTEIEREILGTRWAQFVHEEDIAGAIRAWQDSVATGGRYECEFRLRRSDGEHRWFLVRAEAMKNEAGEVLRWFGTNTDIHDLKTAQSEAERASRAKDSFLATLSHELRTPLNPVLMAATALHEDDRLPEDVREQLRMIERNIALEAHLIDDLLDLTRISRGKLLLRTAPCDLHSLIALAIDIVGEDAQLKAIVIQRELAATRSRLVADSARIQQVIWNLLRNAVKFTPRDGSVVIRTRDEDADESVVVEVSDSGIGIDPVALAHIFLPFEQGQFAGDHRFGGIGLGLAIARAIVEQHGGTIEAESRGHLLGATFRVRLPGASSPLDTAAGPLSAPALASPATEGAGNGPALRLLLVEDHEPTLLVLLRLLTRDGHEVVTAKCMADALGAAERGTFDLLISDLGLPDGTGNELMEKLHTQHGLRGIALSGYGMEADLERSRHAGFSAHLIKPVDFAQLRRVIANQTK